MTAKIFAGHGLLHGSDDESYEHPGIKAWSRVRAKPHGLNEFVGDSHVDEFVAMAHELDKTYGERWFWKGDIRLAPLWLAAGARKFGYIKRSPEGVAKSVMAKNPSATNYDETLATVRARYELMNIVRSQCGGTPILTDELVRGDYSSLRRAFTVLTDVSFDPAVADRVIDPAKWKH